MTTHDDGWPDDGIHIARPAPSRLAEQAGPFWTVRRVRHTMRLQGGNELMSAIEDSRLLAVQISDAVLLFPAWQFEVAGENYRVKPALLSVFHILRQHER